LRVARTHTGTHLCASCSPKSRLACRGRRWTRCLALRPPRSYPPTLMHGICRRRASSLISRRLRPVRLASDLPLKAELPRRPSTRRRKADENFDLANQPRTGSTKAAPERGQTRMALKECLKLSWARVCGGWYRAKLKRGFAGIAFPFARGFWSTHAYFRLPCADGETVPG